MLASQFGIPRFAAIIALTTFIFLCTSVVAKSKLKSRLADGTQVPDGAAFVEPSPIGGSLPKFRYSESLLRSGFQGTFEADIVVSESGEIISITIKRRTNRQVDAAIMSSLRETKFNPATLDGVPVAAIYRATYTFSISPG